MNSISVFSLLAFGFGLGLKHATEADHLAAVSTIVSERKSVWSSSLVGGLWGAGHTLSLLIAGVAVIVLHFEISDRVARVLEFGVAVMLIVLGVNVLRKLLSGGQLHMHAHRHGLFIHVHPHVHDHSAANHTHPHAPVVKEHTHHGLSVGPRPLIVGMIHGLAGSGALMLVVLASIKSALVGMLYILVFGVGSVGGMMLMSLLLSIPFRLTSQFTRLDRLMRAATGVFSVGLGLFLAYQIGFAEGFTPH